jgi:MFS family permease
MTSYIVQGVTIIIMGFSKSFVLSVSSFIIFAFFMGVSLPIKQSYLHSLVPSDKRATIISFDSLVGSGASVFGQLGLGYLSTVVSIPFAYLIGGIVLMTRLPVVHQLKKRKDPQDLFKEI